MGKALGRITNWPEYDKALGRRYRLDVFIDKELLAGWLNQSEASGRGRPKHYSDESITALLGMAAAFRLPLRGVEGLFGSIMELAGISLPVPDHTTLSRRAAQLGFEANVSYRGAPGSAVMLMDSTGLKLAGEGEWKVRTHGAGKRREWVKLHLAIDPDTFKITAGRSGKRCPATTSGAWWRRKWGAGKDSSEAVCRAAQSREPPRLARPRGRDGLFDQLMELNGHAVKKPNPCSQGLNPASMEGCFFKIYLCTNALRIPYS